MLDMLPSNSIWKVEEEASTGCGEVHYLRGDTWNGELKEGLPMGSGSLFLRDGSSFQGEFGPQGDFEGTFTHFLGTKIKGKWVNGKLSEGRLVFEDGDVVEGQWEAQGKACRLKSGTFACGEEQAEQIQGSSFKSKGKTFHRNYECQGFTIVWERFSHPNHPAIKSFALATNGWFSLEKHEEGHKTRNTVMMRSVLPCEVMEKEEKNGRWASVYITPFGFAIKPVGGNQCICTFRLFDFLTFKGTFTINEIKMKIKGKVFEKKALEEKEIGELTIKKTSEPSISITYCGKSIDSLNVLYEKFSLLKTTSKKSPTLITNSPVMQKKQVSKQVLNGIVGEIKSENQCVIF